MATKKFTSNDYYSAALLRNADLQHLRSEEKSIIFSIYCAGVTIECMLRAYIVKNTAEFDSKHDLMKLYEKSQIALVLTETEKEELLVAIKNANKIWKNDLRYTSDKRMNRLIGHEMGRTKYKDVNKFVKGFYSEIFEATNLIITKGIEKWT